MSASIKLGVLGVSGHFINRILLPLKNSKIIELYGIASRDKEKSKSFADKWNIPKSYDSYKALLDAKEIDAVYIPLPNHMHLDWVKKSIDANKHILCEKPIAMNVSETEEIISYSKNKNLKIMEAFMYRFHPKWQHAKELIEFNEIGKVNFIHTIFSYDNPDPKNIRNIKKYGGGSLMDIGCYAISSARFLLNKRPLKVSSSISEHKDFKTDMHTSAIIDFGEEKCLFSVSTSCYPQQEIKIYGTSGTISVIIPFNDISDIESKIIVTNKLGTREIKFAPVNQYQLQLESFANSIIDDSDVFIDLEDSLINMKTIENIFKSAKKEKWINI
jgi:predicted dehydrogenase